MMSNPPLEEKKNQLLEDEEAMALLLARKVIDKPEPPIWMILVPIFFIFHASKIKQYSRGLKDFANHYMLSKRRALDAAFEAQQKHQSPELDQLVERLDSIPAKAKPLYRAWISILVEHYSALLSADGNSHHDRIRSHYLDRVNYSRFLERLNRAEYAYNIALLPGIEGDKSDLLYVLDRMKKGQKDLRQQEIEAIFC